MQAFKCYHSVNSILKSFPKALTRTHTHTMMDTVLFQGDNWLYFPASEAPRFAEASLPFARGIESCLAGPLMRWGSTAGALMTVGRGRPTEKVRGDREGKLMRKRDGGEKEGEKYGISRERGRQRERECPAGSA